MEWIDALSLLKHKHQPFILVTVIEEKGSTPRNSGAKMIVTQEATYDTIGGGNLEFQAIKIAKKMLLDNALNIHTKRFSLGANLAQCCGGVTSLIFEPINNLKANIYMFGAGHIAKSLAPILAKLPCNVQWIDSRENEFPDSRYSNIKINISEDPIEHIIQAKSNSYFIVMTHDHALDLKLSYEILKKNNFQYFGLIGSKTKCAKFNHRLRNMGIASDIIKKMNCPMGIHEIKGKLPIEIAISIAGEIISIYNSNY